MYIKDKVIVMRTIPFLESDLIVKSMNAQGSLLSFMVKGARKSRKRFSGGILEPLNYIEVTYKRNSSDHQNEGHLYFLKEASLKKDFPEIRKDYDKLQTALYVCHVLDKITLEGDINSAAHFHLFGNTLKAIESSTATLLLSYQFKAKLLSLQGVLPPDDSMNELVQTPVSQHISLNEKWQQMDSQEISSVFNQLDYLMNSYLG